MKKFMKFCAVSALVMIVVGAVLGAVGSSHAGGGTISQVVDSVTGGRVSTQFGGFFPGWGVNFDIGDSSMFSKDRDIETGNVEKYCPGDGICVLQVEVGGCDFQTKVSSDDSVYLEAENVRKFQGYVEDGTLYVKSTAGSDLSFFAGKSTVVLYLPEEYFFDRVDIEIGAGQVEMKRLQGREVSLEAGAGRILLEDAEAEELKIEVGAGSVELMDMTVGQLSVEVGMGEFVGRGAINGDADVTCSMGNVEVEVRGEKRDFNYQLEGAMGSIDLDGEECGGFGTEKSIENGADKTMEIECSMGNITVEFIGW